ncbi:cyclic lactone autoinducer peptide [Vallitalea pronyensis]|uniref:Cyclic lactone autoinducer peptide n=1 Tax=Vallitalea pronyensis TaxID=1348613 RepID=A0A8J8MHH7_9FIRM|nr:cyclic lactone autoinducer peptide [Vallitalea pronyensis]QUI21408.1 cyclic lactone autoinducer peptide [Vallitalea pronyensis]
MIYKLSTKISDKLVKKGIIQEDDIEVYNYGFEIIISSLLIFLGMMTLGIVFKCIIEVIIFMAFFCLLRIQAGGYHAKTHLQCFSFFALSCFFAIVISRLLLGYDKNYVIMMLVLIESCIIIMSYAPVDTENKPLNDSEKINYKSKSIVTVVVQTSIILIMRSLYSGFQVYYMVAAIAILIESVTVLPIINKRRKRGQNMLTSINKKIGSQVLGLIGLLGVAVASLSIQTACIWFFNQPKVPDKLRKND